MVHLAVLGAGTMGQYTINQVASNTERLTIYDPNKHGAELALALPGVSFEKSDSIATVVGGADFVLFCVETHNVYDLMLEALPYCKAGAVISGQTSRKTPEAQAFDKYTGENTRSGLELDTIHSMCNPKISDPSKEILAFISHHSSDTARQQTRGFYGGMSDHIEEFESVEEHDTRTANTQSDTSRTYLSIASAFAHAGVFPWLSESYSSGFDAMKFALAMRATIPAGHVYRNIQFGSQYAKDMAAKSSEVERELFGMIVANKQAEYRDRVLAAKKILYGDKKHEPILTSESMQLFEPGGMVLPNDHFSIIQNVVAAAESGRGLFADLKATTPMHTSLVCLADRLLNDEEKLEEALAAPFEFPTLRGEDLVFHDQMNGWSDALLYDNVAAYDSRHARMKAILGQNGIKERVDHYIQLGIEVVRVCRESMKQAMESERLPILLN